MADMVKFTQERLDKIVYLINSTQHVDVKNGNVVVTGRLYSGYVLEDRRGTEWFLYRTKYGYWIERFKKDGSTAAVSSRLLGRKTTHLLRNQVIRFFRYLK